MGRDQRENYDRYGGYSDSSYGMQRRNPNGGYANGGYADNGYADAGYEAQRRNPNSGYANNGYANNGYANRGYADNGYADDMYGEQNRNVNGSRGAATSRAASGRNTGTAPRRDASARNTGTIPRRENSGRNTGTAPRTETSGRNTEGAYRTQNKKAAGRNTGSRKRGRRKKKGTALFVCLFLVLLLIIGCAAGGWYLYNNGKKKDVPEITVSLDSLDSPYAILIDKETGNVISSKSGDEIIYPASMAKIMTVLTAIEHIENLDATITMSYDYYDTLYAQDASRAGFEPGEEAVIRDLLYGALLPSGAECCMELSIQAAGTETAFADLMNQKAQEMGLTQTHFVNCTGLHSEEQYSTPHEIALILQAALKNKTFREVFTTHSYTVQPTNVHPEGFTFWSSMFKNMQAETVIGGEILGGKTGFTQAAGYCLASMAEVEEREYILVTAGWATNPRVSQYHINDAFLGYNALGRALAETKEEG